LIGRSKKASGVSILAGLVFLNLIVPDNAIVQGLPIFYFGYLIPGIQHKFSDLKVLIKLFFFFSILALMVIPSSVQGRFQGFTSFVVSNLLASFIIIWSQTSFSSERTFLAELSQRSYSLYAVHAPIVLVIDKTLFSNDHVTSSGQIFISLLVISMGTEIIYRFVEKPSIQYSRKYLSKGVL
jgi:peptidoglycan/LPS O-acetylase OafA/YrhL